MPWTPAGTPAICWSLPSTRARIASTNPIERVNKEIKRRANVIGIFPNDAAIMRLVGTLVVEQTEEWHITRRYMSYESLAKVVRPEAAERLLEKQPAA